MEEPRTHRDGMGWLVYLVLGLVIAAGIVMVIYLSFLWLWLVVLVAALAFALAWAVRGRR